MSAKKEKRRRKGRLDDDENRGFYSILINSSTMVFKENLSNFALIAVFVKVAFEITLHCVLP